MVIGALIQTFIEHPALNVELGVLTYNGAGSSSDMMWLGSLVQLDRFLAANSALRHSLGLVIGCCSLAYFSVWFRHRDAEYARRLEAAKARAEAKAKAKAKAKAEPEAKDEPKPMRKLRPVEVDEMRQLAWWALQAPPFKQEEQGLTEAHRAELEEAAQVVGGDRYQKFDSLQARMHSLIDKNPHVDFVSGNQRASTNLRTAVLTIRGGSLPDGTAVARTVGGDLVARGLGLYMCVFDKMGGGCLNWDEFFRG